MSNMIGKTHNIPLSIFALGMILAACASAQTPTPVPVPSNFATANTTFLASAGAPDLQAENKAGTAILYSSMYRALVAAGTYKLQRNPFAADLSMSISLEEGSKHVTNGQSYYSPFIRLSIRDTKTQSLLWNIDEPLKGDFQQKEFPKNVDNCTARILVDLQQLAAGKIPNADQPSTTGN